MEQQSKRGCPLGRTFFGLTSEYKINLHKTIFTIAYYSEGAFTFDQLYNMPVYLRNFYIKQLEETKTKEEEMRKAAQRNSRPSKR